MEPLVSVVMPVYNGEKYLKESIESILNQTYKNIEFIIIDDCSTDSSFEIIKKYSDERIKYIKNKENSGQSTSRNSGMNLAKGKYIVIMDADDISYPKRIEKQVFFMEKNLNISILGTSVELYDDVSKKSKYNIKGYRTEELSVGLLFDAIFTNPTVMLRKKDILKNNILYDTDLRVNDDYDLWVRAEEKKLGMAVLEDVLLKYRVHPNQESSLKKKEQDEHAQKMRVQLLNLIDIKLNLVDSGIYNKVLKIEKPKKQEDFIKFNEILIEILKSNEKHKKYNETILKNEYKNKYFRNIKRYLKGINGLYIAYLIFKKTPLKFNILEKMEVFFRIIF